MPTAPHSATCLSFKWGEYNALRCFREKGHTGAHSYCVVPDDEIIAKAIDDAEQFVADEVDEHKRGTL